MTEEVIKELAHVCRLTLTEAEIVSYAQDLAALETMVSVLTEEKKENPDCPEEGCPLCALREDRVVPYLDLEGLLANVPATLDGYIRVPRAVEE